MGKLKVLRIFNIGAEPSADNIDEIKSLEKSRYDEWDFIGDLLKSVGSDDFTSWNNIIK